MAQTALDGHWRGPALVARTLRDAGFEVVVLGMARGEEIVRAAIDEDVDVIGLHVGGHIAVVERIIAALHDAEVEAPVLAGGTLPPQSVARLDELGVRSFPPGSALDDIVAEVRRITGRAER